MVRELNLSKVVLAVKPSLTLSITAAAKHMKNVLKQDVVNFAAGEPDFDTPDFVKIAAINAINKGFTKYTPESGTEELKKAVAEKFYAENKLPYKPENIIVSSGAKHSIYNILKTLINPKDEVIIFSPYWLSYPEMIRLVGGKVCICKTSFDKGYQINISHVKKLLTKKTKAIIINSPSNPTGVIYSSDVLNKIADIAVERGIYIISDEIYENLSYDQKPISIASLGTKIFNLTITINGSSKAFSMTGWRIGYAAGPIEIIKAASAFQGHSTSNACSISQKAAFASLTDERRFDFLNRMSTEFKQRRDAMNDGLNNIKGIKPFKPAGAFYIFCDISAFKMTSVDFATRLLKEAMVATIPGIAFGDDNFIRLSFATSLQGINKGITKIEQWVKQFPKKY